MYKNNFTNVLFIDIFAQLHKNVKVITKKRHTGENE